MSDNFEDHKAKLLKDWQVVQDARQNMAELGHKGGIKGGPARAQALSAPERSAIATHGAKRLGGISSPFPALREPF